MGQPASQRLPLIDALKGLAAQLIVLHHLAFYGPMSDTALPLSPNLISWLYDYGRIAVQVFLVVAGFLAARTLLPTGRPAAGSPWQRIAHRYLSLAPPFLVALLIAIAAAALARQFMVHDSIPAAPELGQFIAHALLLHGIGGFDSLSAGVWYIAIDFQLYAMLALLLALAARLPHPEIGAPLLVALLTGLSLFLFNRLPALDDWGIYFFAAFGLGALAAWIRPQANRRQLLALMLLAGVAALLVEPRLRLAVALLVAVSLGLSQPERDFPGSRQLAKLGQISYALFLIHFPVMLLVGALTQQLFPASPGHHLAGMLLVWGLSNAAALAFHTGIERPCRTLARYRQRAAD